MDRSPRLSLSYVSPAQAQKHVTVNETFRRLDQLVQLRVLSMVESAEPASPADGDAYILPSGATGDAWSGFAAGAIAAFQDGAWVEMAPEAGWRAYDANTGALVVFNGAAWASVASGGSGGGGAVDSIFGRTGIITAAASDYDAAQIDFTPAGALAATDVQGAIEELDAGKLSSVNPADLVGVNASADAVNRLSVNSPAVLFNRETTDIQVKLNKQAVGDSGTVLFQTNFSARAELGLAGDDDFHFKVSPDGTSFYESFVLDKDTGDVSFEQNAALKGFFDISEMPAPPSPLANTARLYAKDVAGVTRLAMRDAAGSETVFGAGGGGGAVDSVFGRTGAITAAASDYDATQIDFTPAGDLASTDVQAALQELDTEKQSHSTELSALASLISAANKIPRFTGSGAADVIDFKDEDDMLSDAANAVPSQQSVKAYVDGQLVPIGVAVSDETTALTTGAAKTTLRMPFAMTLTDVRASVVTAPAGSALTVDINEAGASILSTKLTIDAGEKTSTTAVTQAVISDVNLADDAEITIDIDTVGSSIAGAGLKIWLIGRRA